MHYDQTKKKFVTVRQKNGGGNRFITYTDADPLKMEELYQVAEMWNQHQIASSKFGNSTGPRGKPDCMYFLPHLYNTEDFKEDIDLHELEEFNDNSTMCSADFSEEFDEFALIVMNVLGLSLPQDVNEGLDLYLRLIQEIDRLT